MSYPVMSINVPWSIGKGGFKKTPHFNSVVQKTAAGRGTSTLALQPYATWNFEVDLTAVAGGEAIAGSILQVFLGCYMATAGGGGFFLFTDPNDSIVGAYLTTDDLLLEDGTDTLVEEDGTSTFLLEADVSIPPGIMLNVAPGAASPMGQTGDGSSTQWQLARQIDQAVDILQIVNSLVVMVNGVVKTLGTDYSVSSTGVVTFTTAPASGAALTWAGTFQYLCRFEEDTLSDLARVNRNIKGFLWDCAAIKFCSEFL